MPKMKTKSSAAKRFRLTASGRLKRGKAFRSHILEHKTTKQKRNLRKGGLISRADHKNIRKLVPYL